jgi:hypothetical protein
MLGRLTTAFGVPAISVTSLAVFRAVLGASIFFIVLTNPVQAIPVEGQRVYSPLVAAEWIRALAASEMATAAVRGIALVAAAMFAGGYLSRLAYGVLVATLFVRTLFILLHSGAHDWGTPIVTLLALAVIPWHHAPTLFAVLRRRRGGCIEEGRRSERAVRSSLYGFAVWLPGFTLGLAYSAAAIEKLRRSGIEWVTDGAVRYHFVEDAHNAPFELGMWVATQPRLAVAMSLVGILVEGLFIGVIFVRGWRPRAMFGLAAAGLMAGFWVFQGIHWWAWLMLLFAFLPWNRTPDSEPRGGLQPRYAVVVAVLLAGQVWASYRRIEIEPLFSNYPMYSNTYNSPQDYEHAHERLVIRANGVDITERVHAADGGGPLSRAVESLASASDPEVVRALGEFRQRYEHAYGAAPAALDVFLRRRPFDWEVGRFQPEVLEPLGSVDLLPHP